MIPRSADWKNALAVAVRDPAELLALLELPRELLTQAREAGKSFPLRVPRGFIQQMEKGNPNDPLLRQVLPLGDELHAVENFILDPVGDLEASATPGLLHKYHGRVLLVTTGACAVHCRYCFRRHFPYGEENPSLANDSKALDYIRADESISEVILSGGDPLMLDDTQLATLSQTLSEIPHVQRLRIHTRLPVVLPERVDNRLLKWLQDCPLQAVMVLHINHPAEISKGLTNACQQLISAGVTLFNQSVLLRRVNDDSHTLCTLSERLFQNNVIPYYLHQLDRVHGAAHFEVSKQEAQQLLNEMRQRLPSYLVPALVQELPNARHKLPL